MPTGYDWGTSGRVKGVKWRGGLPPICPTYTPGTTEETSFRVWEKRVEELRLRLQWYLPPQEIALCMFEACQGDAQLELNTYSITQISTSEGPT
jgi:hypothetical protein